MFSPTLHRRTGLTLAVAATALSVAVGASATAAPAAPSTTSQAPSTPVTIVTPNGLLMSYVINAAHTDGSDFPALEAAITKSGGVVVQAWPQIGVIVAQSERAVFRSKVVERAGAAVESIAPTRTVAVSEGTPAGITTSWTTAASKTATRVTKTDVEDATATVVKDPREAEQWDMALIKAQAAHRTTDGSRSVVVGILDSGIQPDHPDLQANIDVADSVNCTDAGRPDLSATGWYPTTSSHGTHVAGTVAAVRNGIGIVGVAPGVRVASVKVVNDDGFIYPEYAICGFMWAGLKGMDVTNSSYYIDPFEFYCADRPEQAAPLEAVRRAVAWSTSKGVVHAAAAGNSAVDLAHKTTDPGSPDDGTPVTRRLNSTCKDIPTELPGVLTVASLAQGAGGSTDFVDANLSSFSNRGKGIIDVAAPGSSILSTVTGSGYALYSGTSMASPHVAGVLALLKSTHPTWTPSQLETAVRDQANNKVCTSTGGPVCLGTPADSSYFGQGVVNANRAVTR